MFRIRIKAHHLQHDRDYQGTELRLPAGKGEILDALDRARVPYGSGKYQLVHHRDSPDFVKKMLGNVGYNPSIAEMNHLAERIQSLDEDSRCKLEGVMEIRNSYDIMDFINATHNLGRFGLYPVYNHAELGEAAIESGGCFYESLETVPDELLDCLDCGKVGTLVRKTDGGVFTKDGYIVPESSEWDVVYDGKSLAGREVRLEPGDPVISLELFRTGMPEGTPPAVWLDCPATGADIDAALEKLGAKSMEKCHINGVSSVIPEINYGICEVAGFDKINLLAAAIQNYCGDQLAKYKAAYEFEHIYDADTAIRLAGRLDEYDFAPHPSEADYGRAALEKMGMDVKLAEEYGFNFDAYGYKIMAEQKSMFTAYGFISHPRGQEQAMGMEEQAAGPAPEQTMGGM